MAVESSRQLLRSAPYFPVVDVDRWTRDAFFWVRDARALHAELAARGAEIVYGPMVQAAYGMEEFAVRDGDGHVLGFGQPLEQS